jgi:predicted YcjX-like family ATPase
LPNLSLFDDVRLGAQSLASSTADLATPSLRIGVTGLSRAGKTVFLTSLVHALLHGGHLPALQASRSGRLIGASLTQQPDDDVARFALEEHVHDLMHNRSWPNSTRQISQLRLTVRFEPASTLARAFGRTSLHLDLVDYPGEWLLDLPLLDQDYEAFSRQALKRARDPERKALAQPFLDAVRRADGTAPLDEPTAADLADLYTHYLRACKESETALSMLPPGRFLMPGELEGSPALTFVPLDKPIDGKSGRARLYHAMAHRYEAYKRVVVKPFFINHFARLDRQIVLVDTLAAINAGPNALQDLRDALTAILSCFKAGENSILSRFSARVSTGSCSLRPRPIISTTANTTVWKRCSIIWSTMRARERCFPGLKWKPWPSPRSAPHAKPVPRQAVTPSVRWPVCRCKGKPSMDRPSMANAKWRSFPVICPIESRQADGAHGQNLSAALRALSARPSSTRGPMPSQACRISVWTGCCSFFLATSSPDQRPQGYHGPYPQSPGA